MTGDDAARGTAAHRAAVRWTPADGYSRGVDLATSIEPPPEPEPGRGGPAVPPDLAGIAALYPAVDWADAFSSQPEDTDWLYGEFLERGTLAALFAKPGTGKSLLALEIAATLTRAGQTVVYLDEENRVSDLVERLQAFGCEPGELDRLRLYSFASLPPLDSTDGGRHLLALALTCGADLVVIDTATRMVTGRENDSDTFIQLYRCSLVPLKARGVTVLRLDHPGKDGTKGQRGTSAKDDDVDTAWLLTAVTDGLEYRLKRTKGRNGHGPDAWTLRRRYEPLRHEWTARGVSALSEAEAGKLSGILSLLERSGIPADAGRDRCRTVLKAAGVPAPNKLLSEAVRIRKADHGQPADSLDSGTACRCPSGSVPIGTDSGQVPVHGPGGGAAGSCANCGQPCARYGPGGSPLCEVCRP